MRRLPGFCRNGGQEVEGPVSLIGSETVGQMRGRLRVCRLFLVVCMLDLLVRSRRGEVLVVGAVSLEYSTDL